MILTSTIRRQDDSRKTHNQLTKMKTWGSPSQFQLTFGFPNEYISAATEFWGKPQEIHLEKWCTGTVEAVAMPYRARRSLEPVTDSKGHRHY